MVTTDSSELMGSVLVLQTAHWMNAFTLTSQITTGEHSATINRWLFFQNEQGEVLVLLRQFLGLLEGPGKIKLPTILGEDSSVFPCHVVGKLQKALPLPSIGMASTLSVQVVGLSFPRRQPFPRGSLVGPSFPWGAIMTASASS